MASYISDIRYNDFRRQIMTVEEIVRHWERYGTYRRIGVSNHTYSEHRSRIIEMLLIGMPQQPIFVDDTGYEWSIIDGEERVRAYLEFCSGRLKLTSLYFKMNQYEGKTIDNLSLLARKNILNTEITVNVLNPGLSRQERFGIYACLKPRLDSDTLSACRKKIFSSDYGEIVNLAKDILRRLNIQGKATVLEREICHLLVAIEYKSSHAQDNRFHIEVASNAILDRNDFLHFFSIHSCRIAETLTRTRRKERSIRFLMSKQGMDYLNALTFILGDVDEEWLTEELKLLIREGQLNTTVNSTEQFYHVLRLLLNKKRM